MTLLVSYLKKYWLKLIPYIGILGGFFVFYLKGLNKSKRKDLEKALTVEKDNNKKIYHVQEKKEEVNQKIQEIINTSDSFVRDRELSELLSSDPFENSKTTRPKS